MGNFQIRNQNQIRNHKKIFQMGTGVVKGFVLMLILTTPALRVQAKSGNAFAVSIDNFGQVNENYFRGAQPSEAAMGELKKLGVKTVIDLQEDGERDEGDWVRSAGMQYFKIPLSSTRPATDEQTAYFLKLVNDSNNWPVYVHCAGGRHRTGEMTAAYRIAQNSWTADQAYQEMKKYGWYSTWGHGPLKDYVYHYYKDHRPGADLAMALSGKPGDQVSIRRAEPKRKS